MSNLIFVAAFCLILASSILWSIFRGLAKSRLRGILALVSAVAAVVATVVVRSTIVSPEFVKETLTPFLEQQLANEELMEALQLSDTLNEIVLHVLVSLISPLLCLAFFWIFSALTWVVSLIVSLVCRDAMRASNARSRLGHVRAGVWGLVEGLVIVIMLMVPISAYLGILPPVVKALDETDALGDQEEVVMEAVDEYVTPLQDNALLNTYELLGGGAMNHLLLDFEINGNDIELTEEIGSVSAFAGHILKLSESNIESYGSTEAAVFIAIADSFDGSVLLPTIAGEFIYGATDAWLKDVAFLGMEKPTFGEEVGPIFDPFFTALLDVLHKDARDYMALQKDIRTVAEMVSVLSEYGVFANLSNTEDLMEILSSNGIIESLVTSLGNNESMKILIPEITQMGMRAIATTLGIPEDTAAVYGDFLDDVTVALQEVGSLPADQQAEALSGTLADAFNEAGIPIDTEIIDCYAVSMIEDLLVEDASTLTADDVQAFFAVYALNMSDNGSLKNDSKVTHMAATGKLDVSDLFAGTVYEGKTEEELKKSGAATLAKATVMLVAIVVEEGDDITALAAEVLTEAYSELLAEKPEVMEKIQAIVVTKPVSDTAVAATEGLKSAEAVITVKITMDDLLVDSAEAAEKINSDTLAQEAAAISSIFSAASELTKTDTENMDLTAVASTVGNILDSLNGTASVGSDKTANLFTAVMRSEVVREAADLDMNTATQMAQKATTGDNLSYSQTMGAVSQSVTVFTKLSDPNAVLTDEELVELIRNINPQTAGMIEIYVTPERIVSYGVAQKYSGTSAQLIAEIFSYMADAEMTEGEYQKEAKALNQILNVAIAAKSHSEEKVIFGGILPSATETVDVFMSSKAVSHSLRTCMLDANGEVKEGKFDAFELGNRISPESKDYKECVQAIQDYYANHRTEENRQTLNAIAALLGVSVTID
ncbi:MAG: hypothetical protein IJF33_06680 [Clostridia bacterium]|nr:hypothetical protein [Clostridia bacterium]